MKVLLLQDIKALGRKYSIIEVNDGYAQNNLFPKKLAIPAGSAEAKKIQLQKDNIANAKIQESQSFWSSIQKLNNIEISKSHDKDGHFYAKINDKEIKNWLTENGYKLPEKLIIELDQEIKSIGEYKIILKEKDQKKVITLIASAN